jgi:hypothetical protein
MIRNRIALAIAILFGRLEQVLIFHHPLGDWKQLKRRWPAHLYIESEAMFRAGANVVALVPWTSRHDAGVNLLPVEQKQGEVVIVLRGRL